MAACLGLAAATTAARAATAEPTGTTDTEAGATAVQGTTAQAQAIEASAYGDPQATPDGQPYQDSNPRTAPNPAKVSQPAAGEQPAETTAKNAHDARIDAMRFRSIIATPTVSDTLLQDLGGFRSKLADYGFGINGVLSGSFAMNMLDQPRNTYGTHRYIGQQTELDSSNNYVALTYDLGHLGIKGGMITVQACGSGSTKGTYANTIHLCQAYVDQELFNKHLDIQVGLIQNSFQYINVYVGGSLSAGVLGPNASVVNEMGASGIGAGAPTVNITLNEGHFYNKFGVQRSVFRYGVPAESETINPSGTKFSEPGERTLFTDEIGYRKLSAPGQLNTWIRAGGIYNTTNYTRLDGGTQKVGGAYLLADHQFTQVDQAHPRRGFYLGGTYMRGPKSVVTYYQYTEARAYYVGPFASRPQDQIAFVANREDVSPGYTDKLESQGYRTQDKIYNLTLSYSYHVMHGVVFSGGVGYTIHPSIYWDSKQGNPLLLRGVLTMYL